MTEEKPSFPQRRLHHVGIVVKDLEKAIAQMERVTQSTAASAVENAAAAEEMSAQAGTVGEVLQRLTAMVRGGEAAGGNGRATPAPSRRPGGT